MGLAQVGVGPIEKVRLKPGEFEKADLEKLKASKTVFICRDSDDLEAMEKAIKEVWTVTEISVVPYSQVEEIDTEKTSVFSIVGWHTETTFVKEQKPGISFGSDSSYDNVHIYLNLWMTAKGKKDKKNKKRKKSKKSKKDNVGKKSYCNIMLHPVFDDFAALIGDRSDDAIDYIYKEATLKNWTPGFIKNYLKNVNDLLEKEQERWLYESDKKNKQLARLKGKILYIPDYALVKFNKFTGDESKRLKESKIFKAYPYKYKIVSAEELSKKILESEKAIYYLMYVKSSSNKFISVYNSKTGAIIYRKYKGASYNLKDGDMKDLAKAIKKR